MAWCKTDLSDFLGEIFFSFKSAWIFACALQFSSKTLPGIFFLAEMLLLHFVVFIVYISSLFLRTKRKPAQKLTRQRFTT